MSRKIKLIWDFRGETAAEVARHHERHLKDYIDKEGLEVNITGHKDFSPLHSIAFMVVAENAMTLVRDSLRPHRGEVFEE